MSTVETPFETPFEIPQKEIIFIVMIAIAKILLTSAVGIILNKKQVKNTQIMIFSFKLVSRFCSDKRAF